ncbi:MAG: hypothetical protein GY795_22370 [Desulfobacterales bacterium]|nr:hypothetical protein [Desulfobacterales bacterium]
MAVSRKRSYEDGFWAGSEENEITLSDNRTKLTISPARTDEETYLLCHSEAKEAKGRAILENKLKKFEEGLTKLNEGLKKKRTHKKYEKIIERTGRLKEKYGVGSLYDIEIKHREGKATSVDFRKNPNGRAKEEKLGDYVLRTNRSDITDEEISEMHRSLTTLEGSFRCMKSELGMRPNWHKKDDMSTAHIFVTVTAYHIIAGILKKLRASGIKYNWNTVRNILSTHIRVTTTFNTENGDTINIRTSTAPTTGQKEIYNSLEIKDNPLKRVQVGVPVKK